MADDITLTIPAALLDDVARAAMAQAEAIAGEIAEMLAWDITINGPDESVFVTAMQGDMIAETAPRLDRAIGLQRLVKSLKGFTALDPVRVVWGDVARAAEARGDATVAAYATTHLMSEREHTAHLVSMANVLTGADAAGRDE